MISMVMKMENQYLLQFAKMMKNALSHNEFLYRYAGDEFIVLSNPQ